MIDSICMHCKHARIEPKTPPRCIFNRDPEGDSCRSFLERYAEEEREAIKWADGIEL